MNDPEKTLKVTALPLVSIIIPAYNAERYIGETLQSLFDQEYENLEIIVVNDGSTDRTEEILQTYAGRKGFKVISQKNQGCSAAKNTGLSAATGDYIQYLDADDILSDDKIGEQVMALGDGRNKIAVSRTKAFYSHVREENMAEIDTEFLYSTDNSLEFLLNLYGLKGRNGMVQPNAFLMPRPLAEKIGSWDVSISPSPDEDGEYFCRAILASEGVVYTGKGINYYRKRLNSNDSLSRQVSHRHAEGALRSLRLITGHLLSKEDSPRTRKVMAWHLANFMYSYSFYKDLVEEAEKAIYSMGIKKVPSAGGGNFKKMAGVLGFKNALRIKNLFSKAE